MLNDSMLVQALIDRLDTRFEDLRSDPKLQDIDGPNGVFGEVENLNVVKHWAIHHSAASPNDGAYDIYRWHMARGFSGIGYHFLVTADGHVQYVGHIGKNRANVANRNHEVRGICLLGNYTDSIPPDSQLKAAQILCEILDDVFGERPRTPHRAIGQTVCPGNRYQEWLPRLARSVEAPPAPDAVLEIARLTQALHDVRSLVNRTLN